MSFLRPGIRRLLRVRAAPTNALGRAAVRGEVDEEISHHLAMRAEQLARNGFAAADAEREARRLFGDGSLIQELYSSANEREQHMRMREWWSSAADDLVYAGRRLVRDSFTSGAILVILGLGIGVNLTAFSIIDHLLLSGPAHVRDPERVVRLYRQTTSPTLGTQTAPWLPYGVFRAFRSGVSVAEHVEAYRIDDAVIGERESAQMRRLGRVSEGMFAMLGVRPVLGRFFLPSDDGTAVVLNENLWRAEFSARSDILGRRVFVRGVPRKIIGIAPADFTGPQLGRVDAWMPLDPASAPSLNWYVVMRLKPGASVALATADAEAVHLRDAANEPAWMRGSSVLAAPLRYDDTAHESKESRMARWFGAVSAMILLIACANIINLMLARTVRRRREVAVRVALGASRARVARLLSLEGMLLAVGGALFSLVVAMLIEPVVRRALFPGAAWTFAISHADELLAVLGLTFVVGALVGIAPALQAGRVALTETLQGGNRAGGSMPRVRSALTAGQAALSVALLIGAGLFLRSVARVRAVDLGIQPDWIITAVPSYPPAPIKTMDEYAALERERSRNALAALRRVPGVEHASVSVGLPLGSGSRLVCYESGIGCGEAGVSAGVWTNGADSVAALPGGGPYVSAVGDDYFSTVGTHLLAGREFGLADHEGSERTVIVNATMARTLWPGRAAIGECVKIVSPTAPCARVVGVAADVHRAGLHDEPSFELYLPYGQEHGMAGAWLVVRAAPGASTSWAALRSALLAADPSMTAVDMHLLSESLDPEMRPLRLGLLLFAFGGVLALIVAALGLYSLVAYAVSWRTREIGVRMALGASPSMIAREVIGAGASLATAGIVGGVLVALAAGRWLQVQLFDTSAADPFVFGVAALAMLAVALLACWLPARRAARVAPAEALKSE